jgi:sorting nexin-8
VYRLLALLAFAQAHPDTDLSLQAVNDALPLPNPTIEVPKAAPAPSAAAAPAPPPAPAPSSFSPWDNPPGYTAPEPAAANAFRGGNPDAEAERGYWSRLESAEVSLIAERDSWFLRKYRVVSNRRSEVLTRRYSDFVWLHQTLVSRYVRLFPSSSRC